MAGRKIRRRLEALRSLWLVCAAHGSAPQSQSGIFPVAPTDSRPERQRPRSGEIGLPSRPRTSLGANGAVAPDGTLAEIDVSLEAHSAAMTGA